MKCETCNGTGEIFNTQSARVKLARYLLDFCIDDTCYDEQESIADALSDCQWPYTERQYKGFCNQVLGHLPGDEDV